MQSNFVKLFFGTLVVGTVLRLEVFAGLPDFKCKGLPVVMTDAQLNNLKVCGQLVGVDSPEKMTPDKVGCFSKCILEKKELLDAAGKPHKENIEKLIDATMPEPTRAPAKVKFNECLDKNGAGIDPNDATCATYVPLAMCTSKGMMEVCA